MMNWVEGGEYVDQLILEPEAFISSSLLSGPSSDSPYDISGLVSLLLTRVCVSPRSEVGASGAKFCLSGFEHSPTFTSQPVVVLGQNVEFVQTGRW